MTASDDYLDVLRELAGYCANCCINDAADEPHDDCAGPEGYVCDCPCEGKENVNATSLLDV